jgi:N-acetylglucosaminyldiphosphoundecaprenol N-acetyl-beta-D-mannosaminyltransferase
MQRAAIKGWRVFLLGARDEIISSVCRIYIDKYPGLLIAGHRNGYWSADQDQQVAEQILQSKADLLFVAISSPKKEKFLNRYQEFMKIPFSMGVGGTFDVAAGKVKRAPLWMQKAGLEWFFRFMQEPRRMFRRYFIEDMLFIRLFVEEWRRR